ncbi:MAG: ATP-binding protein [Bacillus sp. (in: firmicutes)]
MLQIVLRGISGVGKTTLRKMLATAFISRQIPTTVQSKDEIRREIARTTGIPYQFSEQNERLASYVYASRIHALLHPSNKTSFSECVLICDNTHVNPKQLRESEFLIDDYNPNVKRALIEVGNPNSESSREPTNPDVVKRQREQMEKSSVELHNWCQIHYIPQYNIDDHSALETGIKELVEQLLEYKNNV